MQCVSCTMWHWNLQRLDHLPNFKVIFTVAYSTGVSNSCVCLVPLPHVCLVEPPKSCFQNHHRTVRNPRNQTVGAHSLNAPTGGAFHEASSVMAKTTAWTTLTNRAVPVSAAQLWHVGVVFEGSATVHVGFLHAPCTHRLVTWGTVSARSCSCFVHVAAASQLCLFCFTDKPFLWMLTHLTLVCCHSWPEHFYCTKPTRFLCFFSPPHFVRFVWHVMSSRLNHEPKSFFIKLHEQ